MISDRCGVLMMSEEAEQTGALCRRLQEAGWTVACTDSLQHTLSLAAFSDARAEYARLRARCTRTALIGQGVCVPLALLLAEEYPADAAVCLAGARRALPPVSGRLVRLARRNLFAVAAPLFVCAPPADARLILSGVSAEFRESVPADATPEAQLSAVLSFLNRYMMNI